MVEENNFSVELVAKVVHEWAIEHIRPMQIRPGIYHGSLVCFSILRWTLKCCGSPAFLAPIMDIMKA